MTSIPSINNIPENIIFDFGGVCGGTNKALLAQSIAPLLDLSVPKATELLKDLKRAKREGKTADVFWHEFEQRSGNTLPTSWPGTFEDLKCLTTRENPAVIALVHALKNQGHRVVLFSNVSALRAAYMKRRGFYNHFDPVILSCDINTKKPSPDSFSILLNRLKAQPKDCLFIDDRLENITTAQALGMRGILFTSPEDLASRLYTQTR